MACLEAECLTADHANVAIEEIVGVGDPEAVRHIIGPIRASEVLVSDVAASEAERRHHHRKIAEHTVVLLNAVLKQDAVPFRVIAQIRLECHAMHPVHHDSALDVGVHGIVLDDDLRRLAWHVDVHWVTGFHALLAEVCELHPADETVSSMREHEVAASRTAGLMASDDDIAAQRSHFCGHDTPLPRRVASQMLMEQLALDNKRVRRRRAHDGHFLRLVRVVARCGEHQPVADFPRHICCLVHLYCVCTDGDMGVNLNFCKG
mmetsp:Transcript_65397/g.181922  ORF Transcript_65397/g.181922 Transcript_65397/m.181922 type:complete len:262 (+) Transcript_65397:826-1611(+)